MLSAFRTSTLLTAAIVGLSCLACPSARAQSPWNVYTVMLILSLLALLIACLCLWLEIGEYGGLGAVKGPQASVTAPAPQHVLSSSTTYWA